MKNIVTEMLGVQYPIVQGGMMWVGMAEMAAAVSNAGGLGIITALSQGSPEGLRKEIERCRTVDVVIKSGLKVVETAGNNPKEFIAKFKAAGVKIVHKCTAVRHALSAERNGVDIISIDGFECAGHPGEDDVGGLVLIPAAARALKIPVIASGGIADGYGLAAALSLGAYGVNMGTRFIATKEAPVHQNVKDLIVASSERDTMLIFRTLHNTGRVLKNEISQQVVAIEKKGGAKFEDVQPLVAGARGRAALTSGNVQDGLMWGSMASGLITDVPTCKVLIDRMMRECRETLDRAAQMI
jgi:NAD(P)H-dependent flavin oxidoreductase YrpB (nitropropane dioxygenase family)